MLEAYTTLVFLPACTSRLRLGTMVTAATFRSPGLLVKAVTTLDVLSGVAGRGSVSARATTSTTSTRPGRGACSCRTRPSGG
jgi:hypothetical protein